MLDPESFVSSCFRGCILTVQNDRYGPLAGRRRRIEMEESFRVAEVNAVLVRLAQIEALNDLDRFSHASPAGIEPMSPQRHAVGAENPGCNARRSCPKHRRRHETGGSRRFLQRRARTVVHIKVRHPTIPAVTDAPPSTARCRPDGAWSQVGMPDRNPEKTSRHGGTRLAWAPTRLKADALRPGNRTTHHAMQPQGHNAAFTKERLNPGASSCLTATIIALRAELIDGARHLRIIDIVPEVQRNRSDAWTRAAVPARGLCARRAADDPVRPGPRSAVGPT